MFLNSGFDIVKKAGLLFFLLMQSMLVQAQVSGASITSASDTAANTSTTDTAKMTVETQVAGTAETSASDGQQQRGFSFPRWPEGRSINRERIPLAPPGPYMSTALSDFSFEKPSFDSDMNRRAVRMDSPDMSIKKFSPDIPWPSNTESPARWQPENGYRYVEPRINSGPYQMPYNASSNYNYGYRRAPVMGWPDSGSGRSKPVMNGSAR